MSLTYFGNSPETRHRYSFSISLDLICKPNWLAVNGSLHIIINPDVMISRRLDAVFVCINAMLIICIIVYFYETSGQIHTASEGYEVLCYVEIGLQDALEYYWVC